MTLLKRNPALFLVVGLFTPLVVLRIVLLLQQRVPMGHDTLQYLQLQYIVFNEAALRGALPQWLPFLAHGAPSNVWLLTSQGLLSSIISPFAPLLKNLNYLYVFQAGLLFDEFVLLLGCVLLARRYFKSHATVLFVSAAITYRAVSSWNIWFDFHVIYLLPLLLYCLDRAVRDASVRHLFLAGLLGVATLLGNVSYFLPFTVFTVFVFGAMVFLFSPRETLATLRGLCYRLSWRHLLALLIPASIAGAVWLYLQNGSAGLVWGHPGRDDSGLVANVGNFLTYGPGIGVRKYIELVVRYQWDMNNTIYAGLLVVPFIIVALFRVRSRLSYAFGSTFVVLVLFGAGTLVSLVFYYLFPLAKFFIHIGQMAPVTMLFLVFYAGFGFEMFWRLLQSARRVPWRSRPWQDWLTLLAPVATMVVMVVVYLSVKWLPVVDFASFHPSQAQISQVIAPLLLLSSVFLALLLALLLVIIHWPRQAIVVCSLLLIVHVLDVVSLKTQLEYTRVPQVTQNVTDLFKTYDYKFVMERSQDYYSNQRFATQAPFIFGEPQSGLNWPTDSFDFFDPAASIFRTDQSLKVVDEFHQVWAPRTVSGLGWPIPEATAYRKLSGFQFPKLQVFSALHLLPTDKEVTEVLAAPQFAGDILLASRADAAWSQTSSLTVRESKEEVVLGANERLNDAVVSVEAFTFDTLRLQVDTHSSTASVLYYADAWHPKWRASVNGKTTPVIKTNLGYKSIVLPPGESEVVFTFGDWRGKWLQNAIIALGILATVGILYLVVVDLRSAKG